MVVGAKDVQLELLVTDAMLVSGKTISRTWPFWSIVAEARRGARTYPTRLNKRILIGKQGRRGTFGELVIAEEKFTSEKTEHLYHTSDRAGQTVPTILRTTPSR